MFLALNILWLTFVFFAVSSADKRVGRPCIPSKEIISYLIPKAFFLSFGSRLSFLECSYHLLAVFEPATSRFGVSLSSSPLCLSPQTPFHHRGEDCVRVSPLSFASLAGFTIRVETAIS